MGQVPSGQAPPQKTEEEETQNQTCHSYGTVFTQCHGIYRPFYSLYSLCIWQICLSDGVIIRHGYPPCQSLDVQSPPFPCILPPGNTRHSSEILPPSQGFLQCFPSGYQVEMKPQSVSKYSTPCTLLFSNFRRFVAFYLWLYLGVCTNTALLLFRFSEIKLLLIRKRL